MIRQPNDPFLQPTSKWEVTGKVEPGVVGPGCQLECAYCNQQSFDTDENGKLAGYISLNIDGGTSLNTRLMVGNRVERQIAPDALVDELTSLPFYDRDGYLMLENFNDPGTSWNTTCRLIALLMDAGHTGPMTLITKMGISAKYAHRLAELREDGAKLTAIVTYSGLPAAIEPAPVQPRLTALQRFHESGIPTVVSMRPLIKNINLNEATIGRVIDETRDRTDFYLAGGLFVFDEWTPDVFAKAGYELAQEYVNEHYETAKVAPESLDKVVSRVAFDKGVQVQVMPHTSCVIARIMTERYDDPRPDKLAHWVSHEVPGVLFDSHCANCGSAQIAACKSAYAQTHQPESAIRRARAVLDRLGHQDGDVRFSEHQDGYLLLDGLSLTYGELSFVRQATGLYVNNLPSQNAFIARTVEVLTKELKTNAFERIVGTVRAGEEWVLFVDGDVDGNNNRNTARRVRSKNVARVQVIEAQRLAEPSEVERLCEFALSRGGEIGLLRAEIDNVRKRMTAPQERTAYKATLREALMAVGKESRIDLPLTIARS